MSVPFSASRYTDKPMKVRGRISCHQTLANVGSIGRYTYFLNPIQFGTTKVLDDLAHQFVWFRFTRLRVVLGEMAAETGTIVAVSYLPYPPITLPSSLDDIIESGESCVVWTSPSVLGEMTLNRSALAQNQPKWFRVEPVGDDYLEYQGVLTIGDTSASAVDSYFLLEYEIEFLTLADDPLTPAPLTRPGTPHVPYVVKVPKGHWERDFEKGRRSRRRPANPPIFDLLEVNGRAQPIPEINRQLEPPSQVAPRMASESAFSETSSFRGGVRRR
jgi:hypothetical protein